jgi:hypothetical protein
MVCHCSSPTRLLLLPTAVELATQCTLLLLLQQRPGLPRTLFHHQKLPVCVPMYLLQFSNRRQPHALLPRLRAELLHVPLPGICHFLQALLQLRCCYCLAFVYGCFVGKLVCIVLADTVPHVLLDAVCKAPPLCRSELQLATQGEHR